MLPKWAKELPWDKIQDAANEHKIDPDIIAAILMVESNNDPYAIRLEPRWRYFHYVDTCARNLGITSDTERMMQACSYGYMQVMGAVCRELGFNEQLGKMFDEKLNLHYGAKKLAQLRVKYPKESDMIAAYNGGSAIIETTGMYRNQRYVDKVWTNLTALRKLV